MTERKYITLNWRANSDEVRAIDEVRQKLQENEIRSVSRSEVLRRAVAEYCKKHLTSK